MKRSVFMLSTVVLMEVLLVLAAVMTVMVVTTAATADTAFAAGRRPVIGGAPPGYSRADSHAVENPSAPVHKIPATGGPQR
jgi:hypothetical protein